MIVYITPTFEEKVITVYIALSDEAKTSLCEDYSNASNFFDGQIFCRIQQNQESEQVYNEKRWWFYLFKSKRKNLRRLFLKPAILASLDSLRSATGL